MTKTFDVVWLDDDPERCGWAEAISAEFILLDDVDRNRQITELLRRPKAPSLLLIDHYLDRKAGELIKYGTSLAQLFRDKWPNCPIIGFTAAPDHVYLELRRQHVYDDIIRATERAPHVDYLPVIAEGFEAIAGLRRNDIPEKLLRLLKAPQGECSRLLDALPEDLRQSPVGSGEDNTGIAGRVYRWVGALVDRPGFLIDQLWAATYCGLNLEGFALVESSFDAAEYKGIFARPNNKRWWSSQLLSVLYDQVAPEPGELSWDVGRRMPNIEPCHYSKCYLTDETEPPPEVVAFVDAKSSDRHAMRIECTELHPDYRQELYFEDMRIMRDS